MVLLMPFVAGTSKRVTAFLILSTSQLRKIYENKAQCILVPGAPNGNFRENIHRIHKWRTRGKKLVPSHESEALEDKQKLQVKTFSELAEC